MNKKMLKQLAVPALSLHKKDAIFRAKPVGLIARSRRTQHGKLLIVALFDREMAMGGENRPTFILYLGATDYLTRVLSDGDYNAFVAQWKQEER